MDIRAIQMIDYSAIEEELASAIGTGGYKSTCVGRIREEVPTSQLQSLDINLGGFTSVHRAGYVDYSITGVAVIERMGWDRTDNANEFKVLVESVCNKLCAYRFTTFDALRNLNPQLGGRPGQGNGQIIRTATINFVCLAHE